MKTLVYRMGGLGDSLLIFPVLEILNRKGYEITVWGNPEYFILAEIAGLCKKVTFYEPQERFDLNIIFSTEKEIFNFLGKSIYIKPIPDEKIWVVEYYLKNLKLNEKIFSKILKLNFPIEKKQNLCIIHPGSGSKKKNPETLFFLELENLLNNMDFEVLYLIGPAEKEMTEVYKNSLYIENPLDIAKALLKASLYIGLDSGISHLSSYLGIPSVVIFGPTDPNIWHPIGEKVWIIRYKGCLPCFPNICNEKKCLEKNFLKERISLILKKESIDKIVTS